MNKIFLMGNLTTDPVETKSNSNPNLTIAHYSLAVQRKYDRETADFINCTAFNKNAEFALKYLTKGTRILVEGSLQTGSYKKQNGDTVYTTEIIIYSQEFAGGRKDNSSEDYTSGTELTEGFFSMKNEKELEGLPFA